MQAECLHGPTAAMTLARPFRLLIAMAILVLALAALLLILVLAEATLNIHAHLASLPDWLSHLWWGLLAAFGLSVSWLLWYFLRPQRGRTVAPDDPQPVPITEAQVEDAIAQARELDLDVAEAEQELQQLRERRQAGDIYVALFGQISTGKSALVRALLPDAEAHSDVVGGTTRRIQRYTWHSPAGDRLQLTDMPGIGEVGGELDRLAADEAQRAHIVVYLTDGDMTRDQFSALQALQTLDKPLILALNKIDRYSDTELDQLERRLQALLGSSDQRSLVRVSAATQRQVVVKLPDGTERQDMRPVAAQVEPLRDALQRMVDGNQTMLDRLRDSATFMLANARLDDAVAKARQARSEQLVDSYSVKAMVGAMAAVTPGSDLIIQGYLGTQMVRELGKLYQVEIRKVDTELLMQLVQQHVGRAHTLLLAIAGNALKSFPGVGTLAGGVLHAVAYGIIFRTLGRALATTLASRGELRPRQTAKLFEEKLGEDLETSARRLARLAIQRIRTPPGG